MVGYHVSSFLHFESLAHLTFEAVGTMATNDHEKNTFYASTDPMQDASSDVVAQTRVEVHRCHFPFDSRDQNG